MSLNLQHAYIRLLSGGAMEAVKGGEDFWKLPGKDIEHYGQNWLITEFECLSDWTNWEMHPNGDELVYLLSGSVDLLLEQPAGIQTIELRSSGAVIVPRGIWHTARVHEKSRILHVTLGSGTMHRAV